MAMGPARVYLIRHAEKLGLAEVASDGPDPNFENTGPDLSARGSARAVALPALFTPVTRELTVRLAEAESGFTAVHRRIGFAGMAPRFPPPAAIFATAATARSDRPRQTVIPLAASLGLRVIDRYGRTDHAALRRHLREAPELAGEAVLICWHHRGMRDLATALGLADAPPWGPTVYDRLWLIDYARGTPVLTDCPQALLFGDSAT